MICQKISEYYKFIKLIFNATEAQRCMQNANTLGKLEEWFINKSLKQMNETILLEKQLPPPLKNIAQKLIENFYNKFFY